MDKIEEDYPERFNCIIGEKVISILNGEECIFKEDYDNEFYIPVRCIDKPVENG